MLGAILTTIQRVPQPWSRSPTPALENSCSIPPFTFSPRQRASRVQIHRLQVQGQGHSARHPVVLCSAAILRRSASDARAMSKRCPARCLHPEARNERRRRRTTCRVPLPYPWLAPPAAPVKPPGLATLPGLAARGGGCHSVPSRCSRVLTVLTRGNRAVDHADGVYKTERRWQTTEISNGESQKDSHRTSMIIRRLRVIAVLSSRTCLSSGLGTNNYHYVHYHLPCWLLRKKARK